MPYKPATSSYLPIFPSRFIIIIIISASLSFSNFATFFPSTGSPFLYFLLL
jgi:hypothetical protein